MTPVKIILDRKREGLSIGSAEIRGLVDGFVKGEVPDYQMSAFAMAVCCRGMTERETADLTDAMMRSGVLIDWSDSQRPTADKHSTGGVGDKLSLVVQPLAASCGLSVPSLTGRGLGITGGTADKLETIPGYRAALTLAEFRQTVGDIGVSMTVQTDEICPADKKLYALRDVTGTVASIPLICASILSKKLAEGAGALVFDVKAGRGAFMKTVEDARTLAAALVAGARAAGRRAAALVTDMDAPLGSAVGNANEVAEALAMLRGEQSGEVVDLCIELAALMVSLAREISLSAAREECRMRLADGSALGMFTRMVSAQGGDLDEFEAVLRKPAFRFRIQAMQSGYIKSIDAEKVGRVALALGAGRERAGDRIDPRAGVTLAVKVGDRVAMGTPLATLERSAGPEGLEKAAADLYRAFDIGSEPPESKPLVIARIDSEAGS